jgi:hypothetical protein
MESPSDLRLWRSDSAKAAASRLHPYTEQHWLRSSLRRKAELPDNAERVIIATDCRIGFWEAANCPRSSDYLFTLIEMHSGSNGEGEGKMSIATKITTDRDGKTIMLEDFQSQPVMLNSIKREKKTD